MLTLIDPSIRLASRKRYTFAPLPCKTAVEAAPSPTQVNSSSGEWFSPDSVSGALVDNLLWDRNASTASNLMGWGATLGASFLGPVGWAAKGGHAAYKAYRLANFRRR